MNKCGLRLRAWAWAWARWRGLGLGLGLGLLGGANKDDFVTQWASMDGRAWPGEHDRSQICCAWSKLTPRRGRVELFECSELRLRHLRRGEPESHMTPRAANMVVEGVLEGCTLPQMCRALCDRRKVSAHRNTQPA